MLIAGATSVKGEQIVLLGVTRKNITGLLQGLPLRLAADTHPGFPEGLVLSIYFGETERECLVAIQDLIGPDTTMVGPQAAGEH